MTIPSKKVGEKEKRFYDALEEIFVGAEIEGKSGFINLMRIKSSYFKSVLAKLKDDVASELKEFPEFREELFDKLHNFFKRYFSEVGSIHFAFTPLQENVWEKVYTDKDVALFWKTRNLYYVKTDRIWRSMNVDVNGFRFFFDASEVEHGKAYEKREVIYEFSGIADDGTIIFKVFYSERGRKTRIDEILRRLKKSKVKINEEVIEKAFRIFEKQNEVDYFINKDANSFLKEQFNVWLRHYIMDEESVFSERRLKQLKALRNIAFRVIDFISQFEDELRKVWEKPKFVLNSHYVITLDKIKELCGEEFLEKEIIPAVLKNTKQLEEWKELLRLEIQKKEDLIERVTPLGKDWKKLPIDTGNFEEEFKWKLIGKICENNELDNALDGWLIKSENWQALNTILPKFEEKVQTIYIDPPFNKEQDADYFYHVKYKDSTWITMLENRLWLAKKILKKTGSIFVRCDYNGNMYVKLLMNEIFREDNFRNEIILRKVNYQGTNVQGRFNPAHDLLYLYNKEKDKSVFNVVFKERGREPRWINAISPKENKKRQTILISGRKFIAPKDHHWRFSQDKFNKLLAEGRIRIKEDYEYTDVFGNRQKGIPQYLESKLTPLDSNWTDISGYSFGWKFPTENSEILLKRVIESTSKEGDLVMDFFLGSGTTTAVAHKLKRRWIGIEMGEHFSSVVLSRMKKVLAGEKSGISKEVKWQGGGFFKYYELEQFEQTLNKAVYKDTHPFIDWGSKDIYSQYVFLKDEKMLNALDVDYKSQVVKVDLSRLYPNIDVAETLSNLKGKWIKKLTKKQVEFQDGEILDLENLDWKLIKPLIWW